MIKKNLVSLSALFIFSNLSGCQLMDSVNTMIDNTKSIVASQSENEPEENLPDVDGLKYVSYKKLCSDAIKSYDYAKDTYVDKYYTKIDNAEFSGGSLFFIDYDYDKDYRVRLSLSLFPLGYDDKDFSITPKGTKATDPLTKKERQFINEQKKYLKKLNEERVKLGIDEKMIVSTGIVPIRKSVFTQHKTSSYGEYFDCKINH